MCALKTTLEFCIPSSCSQLGKKTQSYRVQLPTSDIDECIQFSRLRCILSLFSLLLVCSDIPRTGLGIKSLSSIMTPVSPNSGILFGPYAYQIAHLVKASDSDNTSATQYKGSCDGDNLTSANEWSYKFDSVSIPQRALVRVLRIQEAWPSCLLYVDECPSKQLSLETTFKMQDALVSAVHEKLFPYQGAEAYSQPSVYLVWHNWIDRIHHNLIVWFSWHHESRIFSIHYYRAANQVDEPPLDVCDVQAPIKYRPVICDMEIRWTCDPLTGPDIPQAQASSPMAIETHIQIRIARLREQYPGLAFDVTLISAVNVVSNENDGPQVGWALFRSEYHEVTTLIRGRSCPSLPAAAAGWQDSDCKTVFVDDYRYERSTLVTDVFNWYHVTGGLRGFSQGYVWVRVVLLWIGCYKARSSEPRYAASTHWQLLCCTWTTFFRIPGNAIVYASWVPVLGYALAHLIDSTLLHMHADILGASIDGSEPFSFWTYLNGASVQMRNIWMLAMFVKAFALIQTQLLPVRWRRRFGLLCVRGGWIGFISALTVAAPYKNVKYRNSHVLSVDQLGIESILPRGHLAVQSAVKAEFGLRMDLKTVFEASYCAFAIVMIAKLCLWFIKHWTQTNNEKRSASASFAASVFFCRSHYLPFSVGSIFSSSYVAISWRMNMARTNSSAKKGYDAAIAPFNVTKANADDRYCSSPRSTTCKACYIRRNQWGCPPVQGCAYHDDIHRVHRRSKAVWSMVRLINLAMFTDPLVLLSLYVLGRPLYLYRIITMSSERPVNPADGPATDLVLLPCDPMDLMAELGCERTEYEYEFVDLVDSAMVPWTLLLQCG